MLLLGMAVCYGAIGSQNFFLLIHALNPFSGFLNIVHWTNLQFMGWMRMYCLKVVVQTGFFVFGHFTRASNKTFMNLATQAYPLNLQSVQK